jgi:hypothetical protein
VRRLALWLIISMAVISHTVVRADIIGHWQLDGNANDSSGNGLNGVFRGAGATATTDRFGNANSALQFAGNGYIQITDRAVMQIATYSISTWFKWDRFGTSDVDFLTAKAGENFEIHTGGGSGVNGIRFIPSGSHYNDNPGIIQSGWNHLVTTYNAATGESNVYMDGVLHGTANRVPGNRFGDFYIAARAGGSFMFRGAMDDVQLHDTVLSQPQVVSLFNSSTAAVPEPSTFLTLGIGAVYLIGYRRGKRKSTIT